MSLVGRGKIERDGIDACSSVTRSVTEGREQRHVRFATRPSAAGATLPQYVQPRPAQLHCTADRYQSRRSQHHGVGPRVRLDKYD